MPGWKCFLTEPSEYCQVSFRRYSGGSTCKVERHGYHNAQVVIDPRQPAAIETERGDLPDEDMMADPRWPKVCGCGYKFHVEDSWQRNIDRLYQGSPDGELYIIRDLPVGAMWDASWMKDAGDRYIGPDGKAWCLMMPCRQEWIVYGPSSDGTKWTVTGTPPLITVHPSIGMNNAYHGLVKNGVITPDCDGRTFPDLPFTT